MDKPHKRLNVWKDAMKLARDIYTLTNEFPADEKFGLVSQMRRAAISVPCNIAEGAARRGKKEFRNFLSMAQGSASELDTQIELAILLNYTSRNDLTVIEDELLRIDKMLTGLIRSLAKPAQN